jgi:hypothetical protein
MKWLILSKVKENFTPTIRPIQSTLHQLLYLFHEISYIHSTNLLITKLVVQRVSDEKANRRHLSLSQLVCKVVLLQN